MMEGWTKSQILWTLSVVSNKKKHYFLKQWKTENVLLQLLIWIKHIEVFHFPHDGNSLHYILAVTGGKIQCTTESASFLYQDLTNMYGTCEWIYIIFKVKWVKNPPFGYTHWNFKIWSPHFCDSPYWFIIFKFFPTQKFQLKYNWFAQTDH